MTTKNQPQSTPRQACAVITMPPQSQYVPSNLPIALESRFFPKIMKEIDTFVFDADGVLFRGDEAIHGSPQFLEFLTNQGKQVVVLTNNPRKSRSELVVNMRKMGFATLNEDNIVTPAAIIIQQLSSRGFQNSRKKIYLIGSPGFREELDNAGIEYFGTGPDPADGIDDDNFVDEQVKNVNAVVVAYERQFNYVKMMRAANFLQDENCLFLCTNEDETCPGRDPRTIIPDVGCILAAIKTAAGREPTVVGKPHTEAFEFIRTKYNIRPGRTMMFGDRTNTDILFGRRHGLRTTLVLSGVHSLDDVRDNQDKGMEDMIPDYYVPCLGSLVD